ncbi:hypothetical protein FOA52_014956 [Chlamydomonas sp. UWO 241]|nr:hypothetical protein FOA52_014956 [Chlamydomonas sp. UWO 241]
MGNSAGRAASLEQELPFVGCSPQGEARAWPDVDGLVLKVQKMLCLGQSPNGEGVRDAGSSSRAIRPSKSGACALGALGVLPPDVLEHLVGFMAADAPRFKALRQTCRQLRDVYDSVNPRLMLGGAEVVAIGEVWPAEHLSGNLASCSLNYNEAAVSGKALPQGTLPVLLNTLRRTKRIESLTLQPWLKELCLPDLLSDTPVACSGTVRRRLAAQLEHLSLQGRWAVEDLSPLTSCRRIKHLDLSACLNIRDLSPLADVASLTHLTLIGCRSVEALDALGYLPQLRRLDLGNCTGVSDLAPLSGALKLEQLDLSGCVGVSSLSPLAGCVSLRHLTLDDVPLVGDVAPLAACTDLAVLVLAGCYALRSVEPLRACTRLQHLDLTGCRRLADISPIGCCTSLQYLSLNDCEVVRSVAALQTCPQLRFLYIGGAVRVGLDFSLLASCCPSISIIR